MKNSSNVFKTENCADQTKYGHGPESVPALPICSSVLGPNAHCFPTGMNHSRPMSQANGGSEATHTPGDNPSKIQNHCQEPYYQAVPAGESPPTGELVPTCLAPTKRPEALWAPTLLAPLLPVLSLFLCLPSFHSSGTLGCTSQGPWKETQDSKEAPHCVPGE